MTLSDKRLTHARYEGFLKGFSDTDSSWKDTFIGALLNKYPKGTAILYRLAPILGGKSNEFINWSKLTDRVLRRFVEDLEDDESVCANTARLYCAWLKATLNKYKGEADFPSKRYSDILTVKQEPSQQIFLNTDEVERFRLYHPETPIEQFVWAVFLIQCYTGCRHSDATKLTMKNVYDGYISYVSQKTKRESCLPMHKDLPMLFDAMYSAREQMYHTNLADREHKVLYDREFNDTLRGICKKCGINDIVKVFRKGKEVEGEKWQFVASHTGRRTAASNLYVNHVDVATISRILGHTNIEMTERYVCSKRELSKEALAYFGVNEEE